MASTINDRQPHERRPHDCRTEPAVDSAGAGFAIYYDGDCPLCVREINLLRRVDRHGRAQWIDIAASDFAAPADKPRPELMARIHGRTRAGEWVEGMEALRGLYSEIGWGYVMAPTKWPVLRPMFDAMYRWFAANRLRITGRTDCVDACTPPSLRENAGSSADAATAGAEAAGPPEAR